MGIGNFVRLVDPKDRFARFLPNLFREGNDLLVMVFQAIAKVCGAAGVVALRAAFDEPGRDEVKRRA